MNQRPISDLDLLAAVLSDDTRIVLVRAEVLFEYRRMENGNEKLTRTVVPCGDAGGVAEPQFVYRAAMKPARVSFSLPL